MIPYIGCVSREDAFVLKTLAEMSPRILEYGSGASTQIFACYGTGKVISVESVDEWAYKTAAHLRNLVDDVTREVEFVRYREFSEDLCPEVDLIFIDCADELRLLCAYASWPLLRVGGTMAFHDTRRTKPHADAARSDVQNVCAVLAAFSPEVECVSFNACESNTTLVLKRAPLLYVDWQKSEGRTDAQMGLE